MRPRHFWYLVEADMKEQAQIERATGGAHGKLSKSEKAELLEFAKGG